VAVVPYQSLPAPCGLSDPNLLIVIDLSPKHSQPSAPFSKHWSSWDCLQMVKLNR
jgi:hypothetical protein